MPSSFFSSSSSSNLTTAPPTVYEVSAELFNHLIFDLPQEDDFSHVHIFLNSVIEDEEDRQDHRRRRHQGATRGSDVKAAIVYCPTAKWTTVIRRGG